MKEDCKTIMVIDDDPAIRQSMKDTLEIQGYEILTAGDGEEAVRLLVDAPQLPCVILLDLMMPGMNGWGFLDFQRSNPRFSAVPVIVCSAYEGSAKTIGGPVLLKPVQLNSLLGAVKAFCA